MSAPPVIILVWNGWEDTFECLRSLLEGGEDCPVWLFDNGSDNDRAAEAAALYPGLRTVRWDRNYGVATGYNRGLRLAASEG
ncbi:MAG: glycosyltransferase, partial [Chloroflexi bacterium]|nr:glycosyltransferase [Chloroflexota bacterium]